MSAGIFILHSDGHLAAMVEQPYDSESVLQARLADYPDLLAGEQVDSAVPRRWLLVTREMSVPGDEEGTGRWSLDHLFLDQDGIPTLVEVKRSSDTRIRREVVGQLLDYAANAVIYWPVERVRGAFETRCEHEGVDPSAILDDFLDSGQDAGEYWDTVATNLKAGHVRLLFVADEIPAELRRIIEFLNQQMDPAEVLGLEIRQYAGEGLTTIVPRVIGQTSAKTPPRPAVRDWDEATFFERLAANADAESCRVARDLLEWGRHLSRIWWGRGAKVGSFVPVLDYEGGSFYPLRVTTRPAVRVSFYRMEAPPFNQDAAREELRQRLNALPPFDIPPEGIQGNPGVTLADLKDRDVLRQFLHVLDWSVEEVKRATAED
jgi:hypothetical protein